MVVHSVRFKSLLGHEPLATVLAVKSLVRVCDVHLLHVNPDVLDHNSTDRTRRGSVDLLFVGFHEGLVCKMFPTVWTGNRIGHMLCDSVLLEA